MKRLWVTLLVFLLTAGALTGCGTNQEKIQREFMTILEQPATEESIKEASAYLEKYLSKMEEENASHMVVSFENYILGFDQMGIDYEEWVGRYEKHIHPALSALYQIKKLEQKSPMVEDAVLKISWEELAQRTYEMELFIKSNKEEHLIEEDAVWMYGNYINALVMGTNGTPIFDYKTHEFSTDAKTNYAAFINLHSDSTTAWALKEYFTYLDSIGYSMDYNDKISSKLFFNTCTWLVSESGKRVFQ